MPIPERDKNAQPAETPDSPDIRGAGLSRKVVRFDDLAHCGNEVWIEYQGKLYRLQSTRQGKLILTK
jgi:hemin uptake protein HemP